MLGTLAHGQAVRRVAMPRRVSFSERANGWETMDSMRDIGKLLLFVGGILVLLGIVLMLGPKLPFRLGRLPGDLVFRRDNFTLYLPIATSVLLSVVLTIVFWVFRRRP